MKNTKFLFFFITICMVVPFSSCTSKVKETNQLGLMVEDTYFSDEKFNPILRFSVCSDVHYGNTRGDIAQSARRLCEYAYEIADNSNYKNLDATLFAGDISDNGTDMNWINFKNELYSAIDENTMPIVIMGNHDFRAYFTESQSRFEETFETSADRHEIINGFHFICLSLSNETSFSKEKVDWLKQELEKANAEDSSKPIFVMQHMNISNTVVGSQGLGVAELTSTLSKYPQVIDFSGHSHFPMKDPRSIHQGSFTSLGTGTMFYYELGLNGFMTTGLYPTDEFGSFAMTASNSLSGADFYIVEADALNAVRITGYDLLTKTKICQYGIKNPSDKDSFTYTSKRYEESMEPFFEKNHTVDAIVNDDSIILKIKQAYCKDLIESYHIEVYKENELVNKYYTLSGYYLNPMPEKVYVTLYDLESKTKYRIDIYAVTAYGKRNSKPLSYEISTR